MKKYLFSIAFLGFVAVNVTAQNPADYLHSATSENEVYYEIEDLGRGNMLSEFLSFVIRQQHSEVHRTRQSGWMLGLTLQSSFVLGGIQNSDATNVSEWRRASVTSQWGGGVRYQINSRHSVIGYLSMSFSNFEINNGLRNNIIGEFSQYPLMGHSVDELSSESFGIVSMEFALAYRLNFGRERRFGESGTYVEFGVFGTPIPFFTEAHYTAHFVNDRGNTMDVLFTGDNIFNRFEAGVQVSVGWEIWSIIARYRFTNPLNNFDAVLPQFSIGFRTSF